MNKLSQQVVKTGRLPAITANTSDLITTIVDLGGCTSATAIINMEYTTHALTSIQFWTSSSDIAAISGTQKVATTNTVAVDLVSDADGLQAWNGNTQVTNLSVAADTIATIAQDCTVAVSLPNIRRYLVMQYNGHGVSSTLGVTFIGDHVKSNESPYTGPRTGY
ncbi:MAG TPA: hypothetical protein VM219_04870 [Phycisphaerae bacterium]|nr:hypothetical protein [Phycisphaerae bacterium]